MKSIPLTLALCVLLAAPAIAAGASPPTDGELAALRAEADVQYARLLDWHEAHATLDAGAASSRIRGVFERLVRSNGLEGREWHWEIHVTSDPGTTAFCMMDGKVLVGAPFIEHLHLGDGQLAMLLAHEMAHAVARHARTRRAGSGDDPFGELAEAQVALSQELEADDVGITLATRAGWSAQDLLAFFDKLAAAEEPGTFSSTHPSAMLRATRARERLGAGEPVPAREKMPGGA